MFVILKPEMSRCIDAFDPYLAEAGFTIEARYPIFQWTLLARQLYARQTRDQSFSNEFEVYLWITQSLFGNNALAYQINKEGDISNNLKDLMEAKKGFRKDISQRLDSPLTFLVNLDKLDITLPRTVGKMGILKAGDAPLNGDDLNGRWDYFFFKYIHSSDNAKLYESENRILKRNGVYDGPLTAEQWEKMKKTRTLIPLESLGARQNE